jgi:hypothetical protein
MTKLGIILQIPAWLLLVGSFGAAIYAHITKIAGITIATPISMGIIVLLYFIGRYLNRNKKEEIVTNEDDN